MKVAVISNQETQLGKTNFIMILASLYSRVQKRKVAVFSNHDMTLDLNTVDCREKPTAAKSVSVFRAMLEGANVRDNEIFDYSYRIGEEEVYAFNIFNSSIETDELEVLLNKTIKSINDCRAADLILLDVNGDINNELNKEMIRNCDAILYLFDSSLQSINKLKDYMANYERGIVYRTGYICAKFDPKATSEKEVASLAGVVPRQIMLYPYNPVVIKLALKGELNKMAKLICTGHQEVISLRPKFLEVMQYLFDSSSHKVIKEVNQWRNS